eukprot:1649032-Alexandrium_andersonii.AAC.1
MHERLRPTPTIHSFSNAAPPSNARASTPHPLHQHLARLSTPRLGCAALLERKSPRRMVDRLQ